MPDLTAPQRTELVLALDDRVSYIDGAIHAIDKRLKVVDALIAGRVESNVSVSRTTMDEARAKLIGHLTVVLSCYQVLGEHPSVQASILISELNLKAS